jgi:hypothetical protein
VAETLDKAAKKLETHPACPAGEAADYARPYLPGARPRRQGDSSGGKSAGLLPRHFRPRAPRHALDDAQPGNFLLGRWSRGRGGQVGGGSAGDPAQTKWLGAP